MAEDPHKPFDRVSMTTPDGEEHDVTRLFQESPEERAAREAFYEVGGEQAQGDFRVLSVGSSGTLAVERPLKRGEEMTITIADADGVVVASGQGFVKGVAFNETEKKGLTIVERKHKVKLA